MEISKGDLLWSKEIENTTLKGILEFIMKVESPGMLSISDDSFLIVDKKKIVAALCNGKRGDNALSDLFKSFKTKNKVFFYSMRDIDLLREEHPEIFLRTPEKAFMEYLKSDSETFKGLIKKMKTGEKLSRDKIMEKYKIKDPSNKEVNKVLSPFEKKKEKAKLREFKDFVDAVYGRH
ncbi:MAG: hypothetical protein U9N35_02050 [Euryarchaeota archaeon]|nr:hypothetical protein [Euryarchaeota archaeon]